MALCLLNLHLGDCDPEEIKNKIYKLKSILKGKRLHILTNIEARFLGYYSEENNEALGLLDGVPAKFRDKQWYAVRMQILERLISINKKAGRNLLTREYEDELVNLKAEILEKFGEKEINFSEDLIPDA